jgi:hypothetical protein
MFFGLLVSFLDLNLNRVNFLPDIAGYVLLIITCRNLMGVSIRFRYAGGFAIACAFCWLLSFSRDLVEVVGLATPVCQCCLIWMLMNGISDYSNAHNSPASGRFARKAAWWFVIPIGLITLLSLPGANLGGFGVVFVIAFFVALAMNLIAVWRAGSLAGRTPAY